MRNHILFTVLFILLFACQSTNINEHLVLPLEPEESSLPGHRVLPDASDTDEYGEPLSQRLRQISLPGDSISVDEIPALKRQIQEAADIVSGYINSRSQNNRGGFRQLPADGRFDGNAFVYGLNRFEEWLGEQGCVTGSETSKLSGGVQPGWSLQLSSPPQMPLVVHFLTREKGEHREIIPLNLNLRTEIQPLGWGNYR